MYNIFLGFWQELPDKKLSIPYKKIYLTFGNIAKPSIPT